LTAIEHYKLNSINNADSDETVEHILSACPILSKEQYIET
jgi:hypothetical protein